MSTNVFGKEKKVDFYEMHKEIPEFFMTRKQREMYFIKAQTEENKDMNCKVYLRSPGKVLVNVNIFVSHSVYNKNALVYFFKCTGYLTLDHSNNTSETQWYVYREMNKNTTLIEVEKYLIDVRYNEKRVLNTFINTNVVEKLPKMSGYLKYNGDIVHLTIINGKLIVDSNLVFDIKKVEKHSFNAKYFIKLNANSSYVFECSCLQERNAWHEYLSGFVQ